MPKVKPTGESSSKKKELETVPEAAQEERQESEASGDERDHTERRTCLSKDHQ